MKLLTTCRVIILLTFSVLYLDAAAQCTFNLSTEVVSNPSCFGANDGQIRASVSGSTYSEAGLGRTTQGGGGAYSAYSDGLLFNVLTDTLTINSVTVYATGTGNIVVRILNSSNTVLNTTTVAVAGDTGQARNIPINFTLPPGTGYQIDAQGTTVASLFRTSGATTFPMSSAYNVLRFTDTKNGLGISSGYYYFFYNWNVTITPSVNFNWSNSASGSLITGLSAGNYTVTMTDNNACFAYQTASISLGQPTALSVNVVEQQNQTCYGASDGSVIANVSGAELSHTGVGRTTNSDGGNWNAFSYGLRFNVHSDSLRINSLKVYPSGSGTLVINIKNSSNTTIFTKSQTISGGTGLAVNVPIGFTMPAGNDYTIDGSGTTALTGLFRSYTNNTYPYKSPGGAIEFTNSNFNNGGWYWFYDFSVTEKESYQYNWSNSQNTKIATSLSSGLHTVTVTTPKGCSQVGEGVLHSPDPLPLSTGSTISYEEWFESSVAYCETTPQYDNWVAFRSMLDPSELEFTSVSFGGSELVSPFICADSAAIAQIADALRNGTTANILCNGNYWMVGTSCGQCIDFNESVSLSVNPSISGNCSCDAIAMFRPAIGNNNWGGLGGYNCSGVSRPSQNFEVKFNYVNGFVTETTCYGGSDGSASYNVFGGVQPYTFLWSNSSTDSLVTNLPAGLNSVTITDATNCSEVRSIVVPQPDPINIDFNLTHPSFLGASDGKINAQPSLGLAPYSFLWEDASTNDSLLNLSSGTHWLTVTDANNCSVANSTKLFYRENGVLINSNVSAAGYALAFDGVDDFVDMGSAANLPLGSQARTVEAWVKIGPGHSGLEFIQSYGGILAGTMFGLIVENGNLGLALHNHNRIYTTSLNDGNWHHVAISYPNAGDLASISAYVDGQLQSGIYSTLGVQTTIPNTSAGSHSIGGYIGGLGSNFSGEIDEVRYWNVALSQNTIQNWMCKKTNNTHPNFANLSAYYRFDEGDLLSLTDLVNTNHGVLSNMNNSDWVLSGAAIGDKSKRNYPAAELKDTMPNGNEITINGFSSSPFGSHIYLVNDTARNSSFPVSAFDIDSSSYFGVKIYGGGTYDIQIDFSNNPFFASSSSKDLIRVFKRENGADGNWVIASGYLGVDVDNNIVYVNNQSGTEYVLGFAVSNYPERPGSGYALQFDGIDDYVQIGSIVNQPTGSAARTIEAWVKLDPTNIGSYYISNSGDNGGGGGRRFSLMVDNGNFGLGVNGSNRFYTASVNDGNWHHVAISYPAGGMLSSISAYVDGELLSGVASSVGSQTVVLDIINSFNRIGRSIANNNYFPGEIDEYRYWSVALDQSVIREWMNKKINSTHTSIANLVAYYRFDDGSSTTLADLVAGNDGAFINMTGSEWVSSGASLGDESNYVNPAVSVNLNMVNGNNVTLPTYFGQPTSVALFEIQDTSENSTFPSSVQSVDESSYFGIFFRAGGVIQYNELADIIIDYSGNSFLNLASNKEDIRLLHRDANNDGTWSYVSNSYQNDTVNSTITIEDGEPGEYILAFGPSAKNSDGGSGNALSFNGMAQLTETKSSSLGSIRTTDPLSVEAWVKVDPNIAATGYILNSETAGFSFLRIMISNGGARFFISDQTNTRFGIQGTTDLRDGEWHHLVFTYDGSENANGMEIYIDGIIEASNIDLNQTIASGISYSDTVSIGGYFDQSSTFNGELDELRIWDAVLNQTTIENWLNRSVKSNHPYFNNLIAYYNFNNTNGLYDLARYGDAQLINSPTWTISGAAIGDTSVYQSPTSAVTLSMDNGSVVTVNNFEGSSDAVSIYKVEDTASFSSIPTHIASAVTTSYFGVKLINGGTYDVEIDYSGNATFAGAVNEKNIRVLKRSNAADGAWEQVTSRIFVDVNNNKITIPGQSGTEYVIGFANTTYPNRPGSGLALAFDGVNEDVETLGPPMNSSDNFTLEAWVQQNTNTAFDYVLSLNPSNIGIAANGNQFYYIVNNSSFGLAVAPNIDPNEWYHVALVRRSGTYEFYINGIFYTAVQAGNPSTPHSTFTIGSKNGSEFWDGMIDEVRVWDAPLTQTDIRNWMCRKLTSSHDSITKLRAYYRFDEGQGDTLYDLAMGNNAILQNMEAADWQNSGAALGDTSIYNYPAITQSLIVPNTDDFRIAPINAASGHHIYYVGEQPLDSTFQTGLDTLLNESYYGVFVTEQTASYQSIYSFNSYSPSNDAEINLGIRDNGTQNWAQSNLSNRQHTRGFNSVRNDSVIGSSEFILASGANNALNFDGINDWIACGGSGIFDLGNSFTISFWMKPTVTSGPEQTIVGRFNGYYVIYEGVNDQVELEGISYTGDNPRIGSQIPIPDNQWHFIAYTYDGDTLRGYLDDALVVKQQKTFSLSTNPNSLQIGARNGSNYFNGSLDELRIWKRPLCETELLAYKNCENQNTDQLSLYLDFNVGAAEGTNTSLTVIPDRSTNAFDASGLGVFTLSGTTSNIVDGPDAVFDSCSSITFSPIIAGITQDSALLCFGDSTSLTASVTGGSGSYYYNWSNGSDSSRAMNLEAGTYSVIVTDGGCATPDTVSFNISQPDSLEISLAQSVAILCNGDNNGVIGSTVMGGTTPYTYLWSNATTGDTLLASAGTYAVTVSDANGCSDTASFSISEPLAVGATIALDNNTSCNGGSDGGLTVTASGGGGLYTYTWSNAATTATITGLAAGTYTVTVSDQNACTSTDTRTVGEPTAVAAITFGNNVTCNGGNDGSIIAVPSGGTGAYTYAWSNSGTASTIIGLTAGTYTVTVSDANACTGTASRTITQPTALTIAMTVDSNASCNGSSDGGISTVVAGGAGGYVYSWSNAATSTFITGVTAGTYIVTVTDANGCANTNSATLTEPTSIVAAIVLDNNASCNGNADGGATASATGGTGAYTYAWSNFATTAAISSVISGIYTVTISDANGCTDTETIFISEPASLIAAAIEDSSVSCNGLSDGGASASASGGTTPYTYSWNTGATINYIDGRSTGTYYVTITDANGCTDSASATILEPTLLTASIALDDNVSCNGNADGGATASATGGTGAYTYAWSNSAVTATVSGLAAATYTVTIADANGCTDTDNITITEPTAISASVTINSHVSCNGGSDGGATVTPSGGTMPYTYLWSTSATTQTVSSLNAGPISVTVTDNNGCSIGAANIVTEPSALTAIASTGANVSCNGGSDGWVSTIGAGGTLPYTYLWSNASTLASVLGIPAGTYTVTITDNNGCTATANSTVIEPTAISVNASVASLNDCAGSSIASVTSAPAGGTPPYTYLWNDPSSSTTQTSTGLLAGTYRLTLSDANGCSEVDSATVIDPVALGISTTVDANVSCNAGSDGQITANPSGGTPPYTYTWSNAATTQTISGLAAGTYTVTLADANACQIWTANIVSEPTAISSSITIDNNVTCGLGGDRIRLPINWDDTANIDYTVIDFAGQFSSLTNDPINPLNLVLQTDKAGGALPIAGTILGNDSLNKEIPFSPGNTVIKALVYAPAVGIPVRLKVENEGNLNIYVETEVNTTVANAWDTLYFDFSIPAAGSDTLNYNHAYNKIVIFYDFGSNGVGDTYYLDDVIFDGPMPSTGNDGALSASGSGGTLPYTYNWSNGATTASIIGLNAGIYTVTVTDNNSCASVSQDTIIEPALLEAFAVIDGNVSCNGGNDGQATATALGGTGAYTFLWSNSATSSTITGLTTGVYKVTISDATGCTATSSIEISEPSLLLSSALVDSMVICNGGSDGGATASAFGGVSPYTYLWNNAITDSNLTGLIAGTYYVTVTDANGCTDSSNVVITEPALLIVSTPIDNDVSCNGGSDGSITANGSGGTLPYTYNWSNGPTTAINAGLSIGTYTVTITDANGCTDDAQAIINQPTAIGASIAINNNVSCNGGSDGSATANPSGGTSPYTYLWSNSATTQSTSGFSAGPVSITVTDANGCSIGAANIITEPAALVASAAVDSNTTCNGSLDGGASSSASGGSAPYTYSWSNAATTSFINGVGAGTYTVTITDANGCTDESSATITEPNVLVASAIEDSATTCNGFSDGGASASATGGTMPYTYSWNTAATTSFISGQAAATYYVTITDANGCTDSASAVITEPASLIASAVVDNNITCDGDADGQATASASGGTAPYTYNWSNAATAATASSLDSGSYYVTITDANGCTDSTSVSISEPDPIDVTQLFLRSPACNGDNSGRIWMNYTGGVSPYVFNWSNATTNDTLFNVPSGTYTVTITDANGCTYSTQGTLVDPPVMTVSIALDSSISCFGGSNGGITATAAGGQPAIGNGGYTYAWSNSATDSNITALAAGTYTVTASDYTGCTVTANYVLTQPTDITTAFVIDSNVSCNGLADGGATVTASGGTGAYTYLWSNSSTSNFITAAAAGTYTVTITDANGCIDISSATITEPVVLIASAAEDSMASCNGFSDGGASASASGGTPPYTYLWSTSATTSFINNRSAGIYYVTVTDNNGCTDSSNVVIGEPAVLIASTSLDSNVSCNGLTDGGASVSGTGGTMPYTYNWSNSSTSSSITDAAGTYFVTITDANGCSDSSNVTITEPTVLNSTTLITNESCTGANDGQAGILALGGTPPYTYLWSNAATTNIIAGLSAGTYTVTVSDNNSCTKVDSVIIIVLDVTPPLANAFDTTILYLDPNGLATLDSNAVDSASSDNCGIASFEIIGQKTYSCADLPGGTLVQMAVFDTNGNSDTTFATILVEDTLKPILVPRNITVYLDNVGQAVITPADVDSASTDNCGTPGLSLDSTSFDCSEIGLNTVYLIAVDGSGNVDSASAIVNVLDTVRPTVLTNNITIYLNGAGATSITTGDIDNGSSDACGIASSILDITNFGCSETGANTVTLTITDNNGNVNAASATVTVIDTLDPIAIANPITVYLDAAGIATIDSNAVDNGSNDNCAIIEFRTDSTHFDCSEVGPNTVEMIVEDASGNTDTTIATITVLDTIRPNVLTNNITVYLDPSGLASITVNDIDNGSSDACGIATIVLDSTNFDCSDVGANTVTLIVTDNNSNIDSATAIVTVIDSVRPIAIANPITVYLDAAGIASIDSNAVDNGSSDNCQIASITTDITSFTCAEVGINVVEMLVIDLNGNRDSVSTSVNVLDSVPPLAVSQPISVYLDANGLASIDSNAVDNGSSDNCTIASITTDSTNFDCSEVGPNTVEMIVQDIFGNRDTTTAIVTVIDTVRPNVFTNNITVYLDLSGFASITVNEIDNSSSDACGIGSRVLDSANFDCSEVGPNTVTLTVTDNNSNVDSATATVTVLDTLSPTAIAQGITVYLDASGLVTIDSNAVDNGSNDNCNIVEFRIDSTNFDCSEVGSNTVQMIVEDGSGNTDTTAAIVTVMDTLRPAIITQSIDVYLDPNGFATIDSNAVDNGSTDNCQIVYFVTDSTNFDCSEVGPNTVELLVVDVNGNRDSATAIVNVIDSVRPNAISQPITIYLDANGLASIDSNAVDNGSSDNCVITSITTDSTNFDCSEVGANTVEMLVIDVNGNRDSVSAIVTVLDTVRPQALTQTITIYLDANGLASIDSNAVDNGSTDNCQIAYFETDSTNFDCSEVGGNTVEMLVVDVNGNRDSTTATVNVIDTVRPNVLTNNIIVYLDPSGFASITVNDIDNGSSDACGIATRGLDSTNFDCSEVGVNTVTLVVTDNNSNVDSATALVTVIDSVRPIAVAQPITIYLDVSGLASIDSNAVDNGSSDNCAIASITTDSSNFDCSEIGVNTVEMLVIDVFGNRDSVTTTVTVLDTIRPQAIAQTIDVYLDANGLASIDSNAVDNGSSDNCTIAFITTDSTSFDCSEVGVNTVEMLVVDVNGNRDSTTATVNVIDSVRPIAIAQPITIYLNANGLAIIDSNAVDNGSSDNCTIASITTDSTHFDCSEVGVNTVEMLVIDVNGNRDSITTTVTVLDSISPVAIAQPITVYLDANGLATIDSNAVDNASSDNCMIASITTDSTSFDCSEIGVNTVEMLVLDMSGNRDSVSTTVTVLDTLRPQVITQTIDVYLDANGVAAIDSNAVDNGSSDNCMIAFFATDSTNFDCSEVGPNTVEMLVVDVNGNRDSTTAIVNVIDSVRPIAIAQGIDIYLDANGLVSIDSNSVDNGSSDNCTIASITTDITSFTCAEVGPNTVEMLVIDVNGNRDSVTAIVTVIDSIRPTALSQNLTVYLDAAGQATIDSNAVDNGSTDNCQIDFFTTDITNFGCADVGNVTVELVVVDVNGNRDSTTATVTVIDSLKPVLSNVPADIVVSNDAGSCGAIVNWTPPAAADNCNVDSVRANASPNDFFPIGDTIITYISYDPSMNTDTVSFRITVTDDEDPAIVNVPATINLNNANGQCDQIATWTAPSATDNCNVDSLVSNFDSGDTFSVGTTTIEYIAYDPYGNTDTVSFDVIVTDNELPTISCPVDTVICASTFTFTTPAGNDNCGVASVVQSEGIPSGGSYPIGVTINKFIITDVNGNVDSCSFTVTRDPAPSPALAGPDQTICADTAVLAANSPVTGTATWTILSGSGALDDATDPATIIRGLSLGENRLVWSISNGVCDVSSDTLIINLDANPTAAVAGPDQLICDATSSNFEANPISVGSGSWTIYQGSGSIANPSNSTSVISNMPIGVNEFIWTVSNGVCPAVSDTVAIAVSNTPIIDAGEDQAIFQQDGAQLAVSSDVIQGVSYSWSPASYMEGSATIANPFARPVSTTLFMVVVTDSLGCQAIATVNIEVNGSLEIPSAFTPNNDGFNDTWEIKNLGAYREFTLSVYNGFGSKLYETKEYTSTWDGTHEGNVLPVGSYYYVLQLVDNQGKSSVKSGAVTILK